MEGLAQQMAGAPAQPQQAMAVSVEEVIQLLVQGATPEQLLQQGIPEELIMQAIQVIEQQMAAQQTAGPQEQGLAHSMAGM